MVPQRPLQSNHSSQLTNPPETSPPPLLSQRNASNIMCFHPRYIFILFLSLLSLLDAIFVSAKQPSEEAVNNAKYVNGIAQLAVLPDRFRPSKTNGGGDRRLIFIGDVHGAYNELVSLLSKVKFNSKTGFPSARSCLMGRPCGISGRFSFKRAVFGESGQIGHENKCFLRHRKSRLRITRLDGVHSIRRRYKIRYVRESRGFTR